MSRFVLTTIAAQDIREIYTYIAAEQPRAASKVRERIFVALKRIAEHPGIGHGREDLTDKPVRFWPIGRYWVVYDAATRPVRIIRVLDGARDVAGSSVGVSSRTNRCSHTGHDSLNTRKLA